MKTLAFVLLFCLFGSILLGSGFTQDRYVVWTLVADSVTVNHVYMHLSVFNSGQGPIVMEFNCDPWYGVSVDGVVQPWGAWDVIVDIGLSAGQTVNFPITYDIDVPNGMHSFQAVVKDGAQYFPVGSPIDVQIGQPTFGDLAWEVIVISADHDGLDLRIRICNPTSQPITLNLPVTPGITISVNHLVIDTVQLPATFQLELNPGEVTYIPIYYEEPLAVGPYIVQAQVMTGMPVHYVAVGAPILIEIGEYSTSTIGTGDLRSRIPIDFYWKSSLYECIYTAEELAGMNNSLITGLAFHSDFINYAIPNFQIRVFLGETTLTSLENGWIPASQLSLVADNVMTFPLGENLNIANFDTPFRLHSGRNLVLMVSQPWSTIYQAFNEKFRTQAGTPYGSIQKYTDMVELDPYNPPVTYSYPAITPMVTFFWAPGPLNADRITPLNKLTLENYPNPFNPSTTISFNLPNATDVRIDLYNIKGQIVKQLQNGNLAAGQHEVIWSGENAQGLGMKSGIYIVRLQAGDMRVTRKISLIK
ncbi:MAG: hypothetical protein CVU48_09020 [Candidatus Cloacimonetes bacterium HGW-Cloacimonetes-1]|jgi:hypothetical protein|nr:MAG: hypothetical protein CVU48_09020 [Candidatus Cloacimonetes bacterium HGW-Cloacimonetes-1]